MRATVLLIFGDPRLGTPLMNQHPSLALDLPTKALVWESPADEVWLSYNSPNFYSNVTVWMRHRSAPLSVCSRPLRNRPKRSFRGGVPAE